MNALFLFCVPGWLPRAGPMSSVPSGPWQWLCLYQVFVHRTASFHLVISLQLCGSQPWVFFFSSCFNLYVLENTFQKNIPDLMNDRRSLEDRKLSWEKTIIMRIDSWD